MANRTRRHANFATGNNIYVDTSTSRVGVGTTTPQYVLDSSGDINSSTDIKINGTSVTTLANNDAVALAIALG